jgi:hypothetical protein
MPAERQASLPLGGPVADTGSAAMRDYESRRCMVCQGRFPPFGFGPPMARRGAWARGEHRAEVERQLTPSPGVDTGKAK